MAYDPSRPLIVTIWEDTGLTVLARILGNDAVAITIPTISSITCEVMEILTEEQVAVVTIGTISAVVFNTLQTDDRWTEDTVGYNFRHTVPASAFPEPNKQYRVGYEFTPATGEPFGMAVDVTTKRLFGAP